MISQFVRRERWQRPDYGRPYLASTAQVERPRALAPVYPSRGAPAVPRSLRRLEANPALEGVSGTFWVRSRPALTLPEALEVARRVAAIFALQPTDLTVVELVDSLPSDPEALSPTLQVERIETADYLLDQAGGFRRLWLPGQGPLAPPGPGRPMPARAWQDPRLGPLIGPFPSVFVGGLVSISAEPPEGFFAASTAAELQAAGYPLAEAEQAQVWLYRVPDSRPESYFEFTYPSPDRPQDTPRQHKFKIAAGLGPASNPLSQGGREADLLWLGDEQHGGLQDYLASLARPDLRLSQLAAHPGVAQRLPDGSVLLSQVDQSHSLTRIGFEALTTDPALYRRVYGRDYDSFLAGLFEPVAQKARATYLLATSRGCTQGCAICCSGGLKPFQFFSSGRIMEELARLSWHERLRPWDHLDVFFLDSNFNNHAGRLIDLGERYRRSRLYGRFRFFVRHNTVNNGFLLPPDQNGHKQPNLALIEAFRVLGIREIWMGVDSYDDASTLTLKSHRKLLAQKGSQARPTYTFQELEGLVRALEASGAWVKGFYLRNNPWVSDLDRIDGYFNLMSLWLNCPRFSIDSRDSSIHQLKPFAGSPIQQVSEGLQVVEEGRFVARGPLGEIDEQRDVSSLGQPRLRGDAGGALQAFGADIERLRQTAEAAGADLVLAKLLQREAAFRPTLLAELEQGTPGAREYLAQTEDFARRWAHLDPLDPARQRQLLAQQCASLVEGLGRLAL